MQNSLERLFEGTAASLRDSVLPEVADPYARAQVAATVELLGNLATRVTWRSELLCEEIGAIREVLATAPTRSGVLAEPLPDGVDALLASRARHLEALVLLQKGPEAAFVVDELRTLSARLLERELALVRTGMYK